MSDDDRLQINWVNSAGSALGAVSAAVLLSTLGTAGTLIGAAMGSLMITIGGAVYAHSLRVARRRIPKKLTVPSRGRDAGAATAAVPVTPEAEESETVENPETPRWERWRQVLSELPWKRILLVSGGLFVVTMVFIVAFELVVGRSVSELTGGSDGANSGTSVPGIGGQRDSEQPDPDQPDAPPGDEQSEQPEGEEQDEVPPTDEQGPVPAETNTVEPSTTAVPTPTASAS